MTDLDEVRNVSATLQKIVLLETEVEQTFNVVESYCQVAAEFGYPLSPPESVMITEIRNEWKNLQKIARRAADRLHLTQENFKKDLLRAVSSFVEEVKQFHKDFRANGPAFEQIQPKEGVKRLTKYQKLYEEKAMKLNAYQQGEDLFGLPRRMYPELELIKKDLHLLSQLYTLYTNCMKSIQDYKQVTLKNLGTSVKKMGEELKLYSDKVERIPKELMLYLAFNEIRLAVRHLSEILPVIEDLVKPSMRPRHWREIIVVTEV